MRSFFCVLLTGVVLQTGAAAEPEVRFTAKPKITKQGDGARIEFAVNAATDVEVAVVDARGKVVRHLAAGVLGKNAPAPLQKEALAQTLAWDGKDDLGKAVAGGPFQVRVGVGTRPTLEAMLGDNPGRLASVRSLAVGPGGELFVFHTYAQLHSGDGTTFCTVLDRAGKYRRTILPFRADVAADKLKRLRREDGVNIPFIYQAETRSLVPGAGDLPSQRPVVTRDGRLAFVGILDQPGRYAQPGVNRLTVLNTADGSPVAFGTELAALSGGGADLALAPDEKTLYAAGITEGRGSAAKPIHLVYAFGWNDQKPRVFAGVKGESGADEKHCNDPRGVAVDKDGNVYVADHGNNRVAVLKPDGAWLGALAVDKPERLEIDPGTGTLYVLGGAGVNELHKFRSWKDAKPVASLKLPTFKHPLFTAVMALDAAATPPVLWVGTHQGTYARYSLLRIEDNGAEFATPVDIGKDLAASGPSAGAVINLELDRDRNRLFVNEQLVDLATDKWAAGIAESTGNSLDNRGVGSLGLDGNFYSQIYPEILRRLGPDLKRLPFTAGKTNKQGDLLSPHNGTLRMRGRGIAADTAGNVYALWQDSPDELAKQLGDSARVNVLTKYGPDGTVKQERLVDSDIRSLNSVRVDYAGNVYMAVGLRPGKDLLPPGLKGQVPEAKDDPDAVKGINFYPLIYGSIVKFSPEGGAVKKGCGGVPCNYAYGLPIEVKGAQWIFSGASNVPSWRMPGTHDICLCESPRFDVDGYGRSFFPDAGQFRVGILDTAGNLICWFGAYGNADSGGKGSKLPTPEIPMYWPYCVAAGDGAVFVGDRTNRRVLRVKLAYAAVETADVR